MSSSPSEEGLAVTIRAELDAAERRQAVSLLTSGVRTVEMPAGPEVAQGRAAHGAQRNPYKGTVAFSAHDGAVSAERRAAEGGVGPNGRPSPVSPRRFPVTFEGEVVPGTTTVRGTVSSRMRRVNLTVVPAALVIAVLVGLGIAVAERHWWWWPVTALPILAVIGAGFFLTRRGEARLIVADLERIAAFVGGGRPPSGPIDWDAAPPRGRRR